MNHWRLAWTLLRRDWRAGEWRVLLLALVLAVGSVSTVGLFADRVYRALQQESHTLLGADIRLTSAHSISPDYRAEALRQGLRVSGMANFPSMLVASGGSLLVEVIAVESGYPLRGHLEIEDSAVHRAQGIPQSGSLWADERMMRRLGVQRGDTVQLGDLTLRVEARIVRDVDQSVGFASIAPRILINQDDLTATGLVQEGSRINYRLLAAGTPQRIEAWRSWAAPRLQNGEKLEDVRDARPEIRTALERASHFLGLAALTSAILAGVAIALAARRFIVRHLDTCAVMRCLGAGQSQVLRLFLYQFILLGLFGSLLGSLLGYAAQALLVEAIPQMRLSDLPLPSLSPLMQAVMEGLALLLGFAFLPLLQLVRVSPLRVIRRELGLPEMRAGMGYAFGLTVLVFLFVWQAGSVKLGMIVFAGLIVGLSVFGGAAWLLLRLLAKLPLPGHHALANLSRHGWSSALQIVALGLGGMALLVLTLVRADLLRGWQERLPPDAPNHFIVNIQPDQREPLRHFFQSSGLDEPELFPMVRGRLVEINGKPVRSEDYPEPRARGLIEREFNLSWFDGLPEGNGLVQGAWWGRDAVEVLSVEEAIAKTLGLRIGDLLTYEVAGSRFSARVVNLRKVQWDSMRVNFFVVGPSALLRDYPASYITSFYLPPEKQAAADRLLTEFPSLLVIDTGAVIGQVRNIMDQIAQTLSAVFLFTLASGLAVLYAAMLAAQDERLHQAAILRTLGADSRYLRRLHLTEFAVLGALSGVFAAAGAAILGNAVAEQVLEIAYAPGFLLWLTGVAGGLLIVITAGWLATRRVVRGTPLQVLRAE
ncbi:MAG: FtsX-like permease family protein [Pseudomonadota bacterium]